MKDQLIYFTQSLYGLDLLKHPDDIACRDGAYIYTFYRASNLQNLSLADIETIKLADIGPSDTRFDQFRQAFYSSPKIRAVMLSRGKDTLLLSRKGGRYAAPFEASARLIGPVLRSTPAGRIRASLKKSGAILLRDSGGLCTAPSLQKLEETALELERCSRVLVDGAIIGKLHRIPWIRRLVLRIQGTID